MVSASGGQKFKSVPVMFFLAQCGDVTNRALTACLGSENKKILRIHLHRLVLLTIPQRGDM